MKKTEVKNLKISEDWLAVIIALGIIIVIFLGWLPELPWPLLGWFK